MKPKRKPGRATTAYTHEEEWPAMGYEPAVERMRAGSVLMRAANGWYVMPGGLLIKRRKLYADLVTSSVTEVTRRGLRRRKCGG
jgi:hypothetical protein